MEYLIIVILSNSSSKDGQPKDDLFM